MRTYITTLIALLIVCTAGMSLASNWRKVRSKKFGISLQVPDPDRCKDHDGGDEGNIHCDYGDIKVTVIALRGKVSFNKLRHKAYKHAGIASRHWKLQDKAKNENGYSQIEAWKAESRHEMALGLLGQSKRRAISHVVFIFGKKHAIKREWKSIEKFVHNINAI